MFSNTFRTLFLALGAAPLVFSSAVYADRKSEIENSLARFDRNPLVEMNQTLPKRDANGNIVSRVETPFAADDVINRGFVEHRDRYRKNICKTVGNARICLKDVEPGRAPIGTDDRAEDLVDNGDKLLSTLEDMETGKLKSAKLAESPWSDDYWPIYKGMLAARYADMGFPADKDWSRNKGYVTDPIRTMAAILSGQNSSSIDMLSPAEKYDLLVGDSAGTLTDVMWQDGEGYYRDQGTVEIWMGLCHGWAPVSYMLPRPTSVVTMVAADGKSKIRFFPSDIKALATLLWAKAEVPSSFVGGRCDDKNPKLDSNGRVISKQCFDTNPGTWHLSVVNQIGVSKRSFVMDATYDYEVWNQPVYSYQYSYFNPKTLKETSKLADARVAIADVTKDKFAKYRSKRAAFLVGVAMDVSYVVETQPSHRLTDSPSQDVLQSVRYMYDLELDANGKIIGGEWYTNLHPDFLWTPPAGARVESVADRFARSNWDGSGPLPQDWSKAAIRASQYGQPLAKIVDTLILRSRVSAR
jgi:hypothetical protein